MITSELRRMLRPLRLAYRCFSERTRHTEWSCDDKNICWLIGTPDHKNLGDHAIAYATEKFINGVLPQYTVYEITESEFYSCFLDMKKRLKPGHLIVLQGGGNFGNEYRYTEDIRRVVISSCKKNPIIMFPQTIFFTKDKVGEREKKHTVSLYSKNPRLRFFAREKYSYNEMQALFGAEKVECVPDIVLSLSPSDTVNGGEKNREGILCCLRNDREGVLSAENKTDIIKILSEVATVDSIDTVMEDSVLPVERESALYNLWARFRSARLVVTDRLHGMIFAIITGTPCFVFSNYNTKLLGVYQWISSCTSVRFLNNVGELTASAIEEMINTGKTNQHFLDDTAFDSLKQALREETNHD